MRRQTVVARQTIYRKEITSNLLHMIRFIEQEGYEKANEIYCKTEEEVNILIGELVQTARIKINKEFAAKEANCNRQKLIMHGKMIYESKMLVVNAKLKLFEELSRLARIKIQKDLECVKRRWNLLQHMIIESLYKLLEKEVVIKCRKLDASMIEKTIPNLEAYYEEATKKTVKLSVDDTYLPDDNLPGVIMRTPNNRISIKNTLDDRLQQVMKSSLPVMNQILFGTSKMRK